MNDPHTWYSEPPGNTKVGVPIIVETAKGKAQVEVRDGMCFYWRYASTEDLFAPVNEVTRWRGCGGFDY